MPFRLNKKQLPSSNANSALTHCVQSNCKNVPLLNPDCANFWNLARISDWAICAAWRHNFFLQRFNVSRGRWLPGSKYHQEYNEGNAVLAFDYELFLKFINNYTRELQVCHEAKYIAILHTTGKASTMLLWELPERVTNKSTLLLSLCFA